MDNKNLLIAGLSIAIIYLLNRKQPAEDQHVCNCPQCPDIAPLPSGNKIDIMNNAYLVQKQGSANYKAYLQSASPIVVEDFGFMPNSNLRKLKIEAFADYDYILNNGNNGNTNNNDNEVLSPIRNNNLLKQKIGKMPIYI